MIKKLQSIEVEEKLKTLGLIVFTPREFQGVFDVSKKAVSMFILNNVKSGLFVKLRNNFYTIKDSNSDYSFIANKLYQPSYVSLETALSHYKIIPEVVYGTTSITTKAPREFRTPIGNFTYQHIKIEAFTGYRLQEIDRYKALFAEPEKALADYLYFVDLKKISLNDRLKLKSINKGKLIEYAKLFNRPSMLKLINQIYVDSRQPRTIY
jgi:predicted transcriptional regulator of viral defense system